MRTLLIVAVLGTCCLLAGANTSSAADHGQVPAQMLAQMGLAGMQPMSDAQGLSIRGMGRSRGGSVYANVVIIAVISGDAGNGGDGGNGNGGTGGSGGNGGDSNGGVVVVKPFGIIQVMNIRH